MNKEPETAAEILETIESISDWFDRVGVLIKWQHSLEQRQRRRCMEAMIEWEVREIKGGPQLKTLAEAILSAFSARPGKYIAFFPSYAYLRLVGVELLQTNPNLQLLVQQNNMEEMDREAYIANFTADDTPLLGLAVLGGVFAEGIDLPGERLLGVMVVGVGLPMVCLEQEALRRHYEDS